MFDDVAVDLRRCVTITTQSSTNTCA